MVVRVTEELIAERNEMISVDELLRISNNSFSSIELREQLLLGTVPSHTCF